MSITYVIQASPLSKLFMPEWHSRIEENPEVVFDSVAFKVVVPRTSGAFIFEHNKPRHINKIMPIQLYRKKDEYPVDDLEGVIHWLTGGDEGNRSEETDIYGVVGMNIDLDISAALADVALMAENDGESSKKAMKNYKDLQESLLTQVKVAGETARHRADERVKRALTATHINLKKSYETLRTDGKGVYTPSIAEAVGAHILASEIDASGEKRRKMLDRMNQVMNNTVMVN